MLNKIDIQTRWKQQSATTCFKTWTEVQVVTTLTVGFGWCSSRSLEFILASQLKHNTASLYLVNPHKQAPLSSMGFIPSWVCAGLQPWAVLDLTFQEQVLQNLWKENILITMIPIRIGYKLAETRSRFPWESLIPRRKTLPFTTSSALAPIPNPPN